MTASNPYRHTKKRLMKAVGAHMPCSCGYMQDGGLYFYIKDYQGNVRVVLNQANQPVEVNSYYPYGGLMAATTTEGNQPYKYSAKELDRENGLDLYDSQARHYDPIIPRTTTMDPLAEKYYSLSPYTWCAGNPLKYIDLDGRDILFAEGSSPQFIRDYNLARNILKEKGVGDFITNIENDHSVILYIAESDESKFSSQTMTLLWNPTMGIITNNNVKLSPTTVLNHEFDHAVNYIRNPKQHIEDTKYIDYQYDNMEERRVITGSEQKTATALGEITNGQVTREDHYATGYTTIGPTTTTQDANLPIGKVLEEVTIIGKK